MFPFKKEPAALRKDGIINFVWIIMILPSVFVLSWIAPYFLAGVGMGWVFFKRPAYAEAFEKAYSEYIARENHFHSAYSMITDIFHLVPEYHLTYFITLYFFVVIGFLYFNLFFINKFAPHLVNPKEIRKSFFREKFQNLLYYLAEKKFEIRIFFFDTRRFFLQFKNTDENLLSLLWREGLLSFIDIKKIFDFIYKLAKIVIKWLFYLVIASIAIVLIPGLYYAFWGIFSGTYDKNYTDPNEYLMLVYILDYVIKYLLPFLITFAFFSLLTTWKIIKENKTYRKLGSLGRPAARFGGVGTFIMHDFDDLVRKNRNEFNADTKQKNPIYLGTTTYSSDPKMGGRHFGLDSDSHMLTIAQTGAGKSRDVLHTNLALWKNGMFVLDPKGEHAQRTYDLRLHAGFPVYVIDPYNLCPDLPTDSLNLLDEIDPYSPSASDDIHAITYACIPPDDKESGGSKHFRETAQTLLAGLIAHVLTTYPKEEQNLTTVFDLYLCGRADGTLINPEKFYKVLADMGRNPACSKLPMQAVTMLLRTKEGERGSIFSTFMRSVSWTQSQAIKNVLNQSTFSLNDIRGENATVYLVVPFGYMRPQARWIRSIIGLLFKRAEFPLTPTDRSKKALFVLDEFLQLEQCRAVKEGLIISRGSGVKLWLLSQSLSGINEYYPNANEMLGACDKQFFGTDSVEDLQYLESVLGEYENIIVEGKKDEPRTQREINKLMTSTEISSVIAKSEAGEGYQIIKPTNALPVILDLVPCYWVINKHRYDEFKEVQVAPYEEWHEKTEEEEKEIEGLSEEDIINIFTETQFKKNKADKDKTNNSFNFKSGEKGPLRNDLDKLRKEFDEFKEKMKNM